MNYIETPHRIYSKDEYGRILCEISFPETAPGRYNIEDVYVDADTADQADFKKIGMELLDMALARIRERGGSVSASDTFAAMMLREKGLL